MLIEDLRDYLLAQPSVSSLVGTRIVPDALPQESLLPGCDIELVNTSHDHYLGGLAGMANSTVAIDCYGSTRSSAHEVAAAVMFSGVTTLRGVVGGTSVSGIRLTGGPSDAVEEVDPGTDDRRFVSTLILEVHWAEQCD